MARRDDQRHVAERAQVRREVGRRNRRNLDVELDVRRGLGRILERRLERLPPRVVGDHHPDAPDLTSLRELHDRLSNHGSGGQARAERVATRLRQDLVVPRLHEEQRDLPFLGEPRRRQADPTADDAPDRDDVLLLGQPPEAVDGRRGVRGLVVGDGEIELAPLPAPLHAARPVDLVHGKRRTGTHLKTPRREVGRERREHADLDRTSLGGSARPAVGARSTQHGSEERDGAHGRNQSVPLHDSLLTSCLPTTRLAPTRWFVPSHRSVHTEPTSCAVDTSDDAHAPVVARAVDRAPSGPARASRGHRAHVYNTSSAASSMRLRVQHASGVCIQAL